MNMRIVPLKLATALAFHVSMSPPTNPSQPHVGRPGERYTIDAIARFIAALLTKGFYWASALTDTFILLTPHVPTLVQSTTDTLFVWIKNPMVYLTQFSHISLPINMLPLVLVGTTFALAGAILRRTAYEALGQFYACPNPGLSVCRPRGRLRRHVHTLITTGPYAFVQHPGYAGLVLCTIGLAMFHFDTLVMRYGLIGLSSWDVISSAVGDVSAWMCTTALVCATFTTVGAVRRIEEEERALRARFREEWDAWAEKVRYKLVPGVY